MCIRPNNYAPNVKAIFTEIHSELLKVTNFLIPFTPYCRNEYAEKNSESNRQDLSCFN